MSERESWTFETLRQHLCSMIDANDKRYEQRFKDSQTAVDAALNAARTAVDAALTSAKEAVTKAEMASEKRFEGVNEFRATLSDQQRTLIPRAEAELRFSSLEKQISELKTAQVGNVERRAGGMDMRSAIIAGIGILIGIIGLSSRFVTP